MLQTVERSHVLCSRYPLGSDSPWPIPPLRNISLLGLKTALETWLLFSLSIRLLRWNSFLLDHDQGPIIVLPCPSIRPLWCWCQCWWYCQCWGSVVVVRYACQKSRLPCLIYVLSKGPSNVTVKSLCPPDPQNVFLDLLKHSRSPKLPNKSEDQSNLPIDPLDSLGPPWPPETPLTPWDPLLVPLEPFWTPLQPPFLKAYHLDLWIMIKNQLADLSRLFGLVFTWFDRSHLCLSKKTTGGLCQEFHPSSVSSSWC